ncbi:MAG TPA: hypothetical protein VJJ47_01315 [Candidatus Paceibacterota bacterium]
MQMRGRRAAFQVGVGVLVMLMPVLGFPFVWETAAQYILGAAIIVLALPFSVAGTCRAMFRRPGTCEPAAAAPPHDAGEANRL